MSPADAVDLVRTAFERVGIRYAVGGSWASTAFGEPRFTNDVDIVAEHSEANPRGFMRNLPDVSLTAPRPGRQRRRLLLRFCRQRPQNTPSKYAKSLYFQNIMMLA